MIPLNQEQHLGRKAYIILLCRKMISGLISLLVVIAVLMIRLYITLNPYYSSIANNIVIGLFLLTVVIIFMNILTARFQYKNHTFMFEEFDLKFTKGTFTSVVTSIPYRQMQDVNLERNMLHQLTGTSRITIDSAGQDEKGDHSQSDIELDPIDKELAEDIRLMLQRKIGVQVIQTEKEADRAASVS